MAAIGIGLGWVAYWMGLYGYCLVRGYNVTPRQLLSTKVWPPGPGTTQQPVPNPIPGAPGALHPGPNPVPGSSPTYLV